MPHEPKNSQSIDPRKHQRTGLPNLPKPAKAVTNADVLAAFNAATQEIANAMADAVAAKLMEGARNGKLTSVIIPEMSDANEMLKAADSYSRVQDERDPLHTAVVQTLRERGFVVVDLVAMVAI